MSMQTVAETPTFTREAERLLTAREKDDVINTLAAFPEAGDEIPGTGGVRKVRVASGGKGKRGGARVIYYFYNETMPLYALLVYGKGQKADLNPDEKKAVRAFVEALKAAMKKQRRRK